MILTGRINRHFGTKLLIYFLLVIPGLLHILESPCVAQTITCHADVEITATAADFNAGQKYTYNHTIYWTGSGGWIIEVRSLTADLGDSDDTTYTKPLSDFLWRTAPSGPWNAITTSYVTVKSRASGAGSGNFDMDYRFLLDWATDRPGAYIVNLEYQITAY